MEKYLVFIVQGYNGILGDGRLDDVCTLTLMVDSEKAALTRAKKLITKKHYRVAEVIENYVKP